MAAEPQPHITRARPAWQAFGLILVAVGVVSLVLLIMPLQSNPEEKDVLPRQTGDTYIGSSAWGVVGSIAVLGAGLVIAGKSRRRRVSR